MTFIYTHPALAEVTSVDANTFNSKIFSTVQKYMTPLGGTIVLVCIIVGGVRLAISAYSPEKRKQNMDGLWYVLIAAIVIGGSMFFAGVFMGVGESFN